jgi:acetyl-CoA carboxylase biotin carboxyl carrier protein
MTKLTVDKDLIRELKALLDETGLSEIEIEKDGQRVRIARELPDVRAAASLAAPADPVAAVAPPAADQASHPGAVNSPMVGTAYLAAEPGTPPFVETGDTVVEGQTLLIVEAMKTMNPITAPRRGTVSQILVSNGAPIEYGEVLMIIE